MLTGLKRAVIERLGINRVARATDEQAAELAALRDELAALRAGAVPSSAPAAAGDPQADIWRRVTLGAAVAATQVAPPTTISVVMATRNRAELLRRAVQSLFAQTHREWQLVVVDDGSTDGTAAALAALDDERVVRLRTDGIGAAGARNLALSHATGEWVAFLDDDNVMDPGWLHAVAVFADRTPGAEAVFGAQLRQHEADPALSFADAYVLFADPVDPAGLTFLNTIDLGALAVVRGAAELHFDDALPRFIDWDLVCRLAAVHHLHALPVWTGIYTTDAAQRITGKGGTEAIDAFRRRLTDPDDPAGKPGRN